MTSSRSPTVARAARIVAASRRPALPFGNGRSYGDVCLNEAGVLWSTRGLDRFIASTRRPAVLDCEAGVTLDEIIEFALPRGWFLPVTPGTRYVTLGGAIANDVHGKNHHRAGTFGEHVQSLTLLRTDGRAHRLRRRSTSRLVPRDGRRPRPDRPDRAARRCACGRSPAPGSTSTTIAVRLARRVLRAVARPRATH